MFNLVVLASGNGSNLQAIIDAIANHTLKQVQIIKVISDRDCYALTRATNFGIANRMVSRKEYGINLSDAIADEIPPNTNLIVLAGFLSILNHKFITQFPHQIINIHPSLLPKYGGIGMWGLKVHEAVIDNRDTHSGCSVHYVDSGIDSGDVILQKSLVVNPDDTATDLQTRIHILEHQALIEALQLLTKSENNHDKARTN